MKTNEVKIKEMHTDWDNGALIRTYVTRDTSQISDAFYHQLTPYDAQIMKLFDNDITHARTIINAGVMENYLLTYVDKILKADCEELGLVFKKTVRVHYDFASKDNIPEAWKAQKREARKCKLS